MKVLFVSVHPDDETLGCGGTILKHRTNGDDLYWLIVTDVCSCKDFSDDYRQKRKSEIERVKDEYQFKKIFNLSFPPAGLHLVNFNELLSAISNVMNEIKPETIYTVNHTDVHTDHQITAKAVSSCTKSFRYPFIKRILMYECLSETEMAQPISNNIFIPNVYSDITDHIEKKLQIMKIYGTEVQDAPLPRSLENIKALARFRGSSVGVHFAEAFMLVRDII